LNKKEKIVILGAGVGGLSAGYFLANTGKYEVVVLEKAQTVGGMSGSFNHAGFVLDYGPHKIYSIIPGIMEEIAALMGGQLLKIPKKNRIFLRGHLLDYPLRIGNLAKALGIKTFLELGIGYALTFLRGFFARTPAFSYEEYIIKKFGSATYKLVFEPLADKVWGEPVTLHPDMASCRIPASSGLDVILKLLGFKKESAETSAPFFYYPRKGFQDFPETLKEKIEEKEGRVVVNVDLTGVESAGNKINAVLAAVNGRPHCFPCDYLISSIPLSALGHLIFSNSNEEFNRAVKNLQFRHLILVYLFINKPLILSEQWIFFPEKEFIFSRISEQKQMNFDLGPPDKTAICADFTCAEDSWQWQANDTVLIEKCVEGLIRAGLVQSENIIDHRVGRFRDFYPRYDLEYKEKIDRVCQPLQQFSNLFLTGRLGMYNYNNTDHCFDMGKFIAEGLAMNKDIQQIRQELLKRVANYKIVD